MKDTNIIELDHWLLSRILRYEIVEAMTAEWVPWSTRGRECSGPSNSSVSILTSVLGMGNRPKNNYIIHCLVHACSSFLYFCPNMCGIYGASIDVSEDEVRKKLGLSQHRGADHSEVKVLEYGVLAHNRLSVIDLDARSNQPFWYHGVCISYNGEIYNFKSLRDELQGKGYSFVTTSDTEVVCAAYLEYGPDCLEKFNGMFAFVLYDSKKCSFFGGRDRMGQKPLFYSLREGFECASQANQIGKYNSLSQNRDAIAEYLRWGYIPDPLCVFSGVQKLMPGHGFEFSLLDQRFRTWSFWKLNTNVSTYEGSFDEACSDLKGLLKDSIAKRMVSDVPLGMFLSGGVDSSLICALAAEENPIKTYCVKFFTPEFDESAHAKVVSDMLKTDHTEIECSEKEGLDMVDSLNSYFDEPFADSSAIPTMLLSKYTRKQVKVALSGDGADEMFLGYNRYERIMELNYLMKIPQVIRRGLTKKASFEAGKRAYVKAKGARMSNIEELFRNKMMIMDDRGLIKNDIDHQKHWNYLLYSRRDLLDRVSDFDMATYLVGDINTKIDRASMAFTLELRSPFMDHRVVEFARSLPVRYKYDRGNKKRILKEILFSMMPKHVFERPKSGFRVPISSWIRSVLKERVYDTLNMKALSCIPEVCSETIHGLIENHMAGKEDNGMMIWRLLVLTDWNRRHGIK